MMTKLITFTFGLLFTVTLNAQLYSSTSSKITFDSKTPMEDIHAETTKGKALINSADKRIKVKIKMISFKFEKPLMEEHFNEKYVESEKYPDAEFDGNIVENIDFSKDGTHQVNVKGKLTIHGVTQERTLTGTITIKGGKIELLTKFQVKLVDHKIEVPSVVTKNIAEVIDVDASFICEEYKK